MYQRESPDMKNTSVAFAATLLLSVLFFSACKEIGPEINLKDNPNSIADTTYVETPVATAETKNVLVEEFTGVRCPNCPQGHVTIANIKSAHPARVSSVSLHPINSLGVPYPFSVQDFRSSKAQTLFDYLEQIGFEPAAAIDRIPASGTSVLCDYNEWGAKVNSQLAISTPVNLILSKSFDTTNNELTIVAELHYTQNVAEENKLTIVLTESDIVSAQLDGSVIDTFYLHKDVMRDFVTSIQGDAITQTREAGRVVRKVYKKIIDAAWKPENMLIIAYVHEYLNTKKVYQTKEIEVQ